MLGPDVAGSHLHNAQPIGANSCIHPDLSLSAAASVLKGVGDGF